MKRLSSVLAGFALLASAAFGQTSLLNTTLSAALTSTAKVFAVAAATNITAPGNPISLSSIGAPSGSSQWIVYVDREAMSISAVSSTTLTVVRGVQGTKSAAHASGAKVLAGPISAFVTTDPTGTCTRTLLAYVPVVNVLNGSVNDCTSGAWSNFTTNLGTGSVLGSTATMTGASAVLAKVTHISGTAAIVTITVPAGLMPGNSLTVIPDAAFTYTTAGNISIAGTGVIGKALTLTYDGTKLNPSY